MTLLERTSALARDGGLTLRTERLILRPPHPADAPALAALLNDRRIAENTARVPHPYTLADALGFIGSVESGGEPSFLITLLDGAIVGGCGIGTLRRDGPEIGYWVGIPHWGNGYATEAAQALLAHAFEDLGHEVLFGGAHVSNPASARVLQKCGFVWTGCVLQRVPALGTSVPCDRFRLERERWTSLQPPAETLAAA